MGAGVDTQMGEAESLDNMRAERARWDALLARVGEQTME
jgi:hypothetical protein